MSGGLSNGWHNVLSEVVKGILFQKPPNSRVSLGHFPLDYRVGPVADRVATLRNGLIFEVTGVITPRTARGPPCTIRVPVAVNNDLMLTWFAQPHSYPKGEGSNCWE